MENETYEINKEENEFKYVKNLCIDMDNGKITIKSLYFILINSKVIYMVEKFQNFYLILPAIEIVIIVNIFKQNQIVYLGKIKYLILKIIHIL